MASKTLISGTAYDIKGGRTLINGTGYDIQKGRTLINGTGYDIEFNSPHSIWFGASARAIDYFRIKYKGNYIYPVIGNDVNFISEEPFDIEILGSVSWLRPSVNVNGVVVQTGNMGSNLIYTFSSVSDTRIVGTISGVILTAEITYPYSP